MNRNYLFAMVLGILLFSSFSFASTDTITGRIVYAGNLSPINGANVTISNNSMGMFGPVTQLVNSTLTNATGGFNLSFDNSTMGTNFVFEVYAFNSSNPTQILYMSNILPPMPSMQLDSMFSTLNSTNLSIGLVPAVNLFVNATNSTGNLVNFNYFLEGQSFGNLYGTGQNVSNASVYLVANKNYTFIIMNPNDPRGGFPRSLNFSASTLTSAVGNQVNSTVNLSQSISFMNGSMNVTGNSTAVNFTTIVFYPTGGNNMMMFGPNGGFLNPSSLNTSPFGPGENLNVTSGLYNASIIGATGSGISYMALGLGVDANSNYYGGFQNITVISGQNISINLTLRPMIGSYLPTGYTSGQQADPNTSKFFINATNSTGGKYSGQSGFMLVQVSDYNTQGNFTFNMGVQANSSGAYIFPIISGSSATYSLFAPGSAPRSDNLNLSGNFTNLAIAGLEFTAPNGSFINTNNIQMTFSISNSTCDVQEPLPSCQLTNFGLGSGQFNPTAFTLAGVNITMRINQSGVIVQLNNVDLSGSGPPTASLDSSSTGSTFAQARRIGSYAPKIFTNAYVGIQLNLSQVNVFAPIHVILSNLYDNSWNQLWNASGDVNGTSVPSSFSGYNTTLFNTSSGGVLCSTTNINSTCYVNTSTGYVWLTVPHFSGSNESILSAATCQAINQSTTLASNLVGSNVSLACLYVNVSNVVVDCAGYSITGNSTGSYGVFVNNSNNVTLKNCVISNYTEGVYVLNSNASTFNNITSSNESDSGFLLSSSLSLVFTNDTSNNNTNYGFNLISTNSSNLTSDTANNNFGGFNLTSTVSNAINSSVANNDTYGIELFSSNSTTIASNTVFNDSNYGIYLSSSSSNNIISNNATYGQYGFYSTGANATNFSLNSAANASIADFFLTAGSNTNSFLNNSANMSVYGFNINTSINDSFSLNNVYNNTYGFYLFESNNTNLSSNQIHQNTYGDYINRTNGTNFLNSHFYGNTYALLINNTNGLTNKTTNLTNVIFDSPAGTYSSFINLSLYDSLVPINDSYYFNWSAAPATLPSGYITFANKYLSIVNSSGSAVNFTIDTVTFNWNSNDLVGYTESQLSLQGYYSGTWNILNASPDTTNHMISMSNLNVTTGTYALLQTTPAPASSSSGGSTSHTTYSVTQSSTCTGNAVSVSSSGSNVGVPVQARDTVSNSVVGSCTTDSSGTCSYTTTDTGSVYLYVYDVSYGPFSLASGCAASNPAPIPAIAPVVPSPAPAPVMNSTVPAAVGTPTISGPTSGTVGSSETLTVTSCTQNCTVSVTSPDGSVASVTPDQNGNVMFSLVQTGNYVVTVWSSGVSTATYTVTSSAPAAAPSSPTPVPTTVQQPAPPSPPAPVAQAPTPAPSSNNTLLIIGVVVLLILIAGVAYFVMKKNEKK